MPSRNSRRDLDRDTRVNPLIPHGRSNMFAGLADQRIFDLCCGIHWSGERLSFLGYTEDFIFDSSLGVSDYFRRLLRVITSRFSSEIGRLLCMRVALFRATFPQLRVLSMHVTHITIRCNRVIPLLFIWETDICRQNYTWQLPSEESVLVARNVAANNVSVRRQCPEYRKDSHIYAFPDNLRRRFLDLRMKA